LPEAGHYQYQLIFNRGTDRHCRVSSPHRVQAARKNVYFRSGGAVVNPILQRWNEFDVTTAESEILPCCGSRAWAQELAALRPFSEPEDLLQTSEDVWSRLDVADWDEAFSSHPRIGERYAPHMATAQSAQWSSDEQSSAAGASADIQEQLRRANASYEARFGRIYIVCATGKSAEEMLAILLRRMENDDVAELREAAEQQRQITRLRLRKWLQI
jgi:2-oxo-4-hydroxy-4-carboxy-5-ureidoimidazoline decarboxylase